MGLFSNDADNPKRMREEIARLEKTVANFGTANTELNEQNKLLADQIKDLKAEKEKLETNIANQAETISNYEKELEEIKARIAGLEKPDVPVTPPPFRPEQPQPQAPAATPAPASEPCRIDLSPIEVRLDKIEKFMDDNSYKDGLIKKLHADLQERSADFIGQLKRPYLKSIIRIHERLNNTLAACSRPEAMTGDDAIARTLKKMKGDLLMVQDMLDDEYDLEYFLPAAGDRYDPRLHNALRSLPAPTPGQVGTIAECLAGGFMEQNGNRVVKSATVTVYKADNK